MGKVVNPYYQTANEGQVVSLYYQTREEEQKHEGEAKEAATKENEKVKVKVSGSSEETCLVNAAASIHLCPKGRLEFPAGSSL